MVEMSNIPPREDSLPMKSVIKSRLNIPGTCADGIEVEPVKSAPAGHHVAAELPTSRSLPNPAFGVSLPAAQRPLRRPHVGVRLDHWLARHADFIRRSCAQLAPPHDGIR